MNGIVDHTRRREAEVADAEKLEIAADNHVWVNAFLLVNPSDDIKRKLGESVIAALKASAVADDLSGSFPVTWIRVNAS